MLVIEGFNWPAYDYEVGDFVEMPDDIKNFLNEIISVCKKHGYSISHEDYAGTFEIEKYSDYCTTWLLEANLNLNNTRH